MLTIKQLISVSPFPDDVKQELLLSVETFSPEKLHETEEACWELISRDYQSRFEHQEQLARIDLTEGKPALSTEQIEEKLMNELWAKFGESERLEALEKVRQMLAETQSSEEE